MGGESAGGTVLSAKTALRLAPQPVALTIRPNGAVAAAIPR